MSDWVCGRCKSINRERAATCYSCGGIRGAIQMQPGGGAALGGTFGGGAQAAATAGAASAAGTGVGVGAGAATLSGQPLAGDGTVDAIAIADVSEPEAKPVLPAGPANLLGGFVGGAVGAVLATALWYGVVAITQWQIGLVAIAVGFIVGQAVVLGAAGRGSILLLPISLGFTLVALVASEYLIAHYFLEQVAAEMGVPLAEAEALFTPVDLVRASLEAEPITLLFWAIAGYEAFVIPMRLIGRTRAG